MDENHAPISSEAEEPHQCHFCGEWVKDGVSTENGSSHLLSDCRPDLVSHPAGPLCTWAYRRDEEVFNETHTCYAYQDPDTKKWANEHKHFYPDGPT